MTTIYQNTTTGYNNNYGTQGAYSKATHDASAGLSEQQKAEVKAWLEANYPQYLAMKNGQVPATPEELAQAEAYINWALQQLGESAAGTVPQGYTPSYGSAPGSQSAGLPLEPNGLSKGGGDNYVATQPENQIGLKFPDDSNQYPTYVWGNSLDLYVAYADASVTYTQTTDPVTGEPALLITITSPSTGQSKQVYVMDPDTKVNIHAVDAENNVHEVLNQEQIMARSVNQHMDQIRERANRALGDNLPAGARRNQRSQNESAPASRVTVSEYSVDEVADQLSTNQADRMEGDVAVYDRAQVNYDVSSGGDETVYVYGNEVNLMNVPASASVAVENARMPGSNREAIKVVITLHDGTVKTFYIAKKPGQVINLPVTADQINVEGEIISAESLDSIEQWNHNDNALSFNYVGKTQTNNRGQNADLSTANSTAGDTQPNSIDNSGEVDSLLYESYINVSVHATASENRSHVIKNASGEVNIYAGPNDVVEVYKNGDSFDVIVYKNGDRNKMEVFNVQNPGKLIVHGENVQYKNSDAIAYFDKQNAPEPVSAPEGVNAATVERANQLAEDLGVSVEEIYNNEDLMTILGQIDDETMDRANELAQTMGISLMEIYEDENVLDYIKNRYAQPTPEFITFLAENDPRLKAALNNPALAQTEGTLAMQARNAVVARLVQLLNLVHRGGKYSFEARPNSEGELNFNLSDNLYILENGRTIGRMDVLKNETSGTSALDATITEEKTNGADNK